MVVVPALAIRQQAETAQVRCLHGCAFHTPSPRPGVVTPIGDAPVTDHADADAHWNAPDEPAPAADCVTRKSDRQLLQHPGSLQKAVPRIVRKLALDDECRRTGKAKAAIELPQQVDERGTAMCEEIVTGILSLRPIPLVVDAQDAKRSGDAYQHADVDEPALEPLLAGIGAVDEASMHADRMAEQQRTVGCDNEQQHRTRRDQQRRKHDRAREHGHVPQRLRRPPHHAPLDGTGAVSIHPRNGLHHRGALGQSIVRGLFHIATHSSCPRNA
jgi:hypothetical protein